MKKIIIFGGSGDLAKRKIMPALSNVVTEDTKVFAYARSEFPDGFSSHLRKFHEYSSDFPEKVEYIKGQYDDLSPLKDIIDNDTVIYLSLPPHVVPGILSKVSKYDFGMICIEKPFGSTIEEFRELEKFKNPKVRFIDHYLLKPFMISLYKIQQKYAQLFDYLDNTHIRSVECLFVESIKAEGRSYFDKSGIIKDVMQNHLVEIIASIICPKNSCNYSSERLEFIKKIAIDKERYIFGQYESYRNEMETSSNTETFTSFKCFVNSEKWQNVPFLLAAGKGLDKKASEVTFNIKRNSFELFEKIIKDNGKQIPNITSIEEMNISFNVYPLSEIYFTVKTKDDNITKIVIVSQTDVNRILQEAVSVQGDYETVFYSLINNSYFPTISFDEAEQLWKIFEHIISVNKELIYYPIGVPKPEEAIEFFKENK